MTMVGSGAVHHPRVMPAAPARSFVAWIVARDGSLPGGVATTGRAALVRDAAAGDQDAFERLVRPAGDRLLGIARKILRDPDAAEDALQQAVIQAWRDLPRLREPDRFDAWLSKLLVSACYREARRTRRFAARVDRLPTEPSEDDDAEALADRERIEQAFLVLSPAHRAVVVLHHYAGLPLSEVAAITGVAPGTARSRLHYALRALRAALEAADRPQIEEIP
jgi:RNA polymerase sigma-70 factor (ECF subfamily)